MAALYLGTGPLELDMIQAINKTAAENPNLELGILFDYFRGNRSVIEGGTKSSAVELLQKLGKHTEVRLFYHPDMRGFLKNVLPERVNELVGVQHMKFFIFDDSIIISGKYKEAIKLDKDKVDTYICPFLQMGVFNLHQEVDLLTKLFNYEKTDIKVTLSTGYFNLYEKYAESILHSTTYPISANGFYGASGLSGYVPSLYVHSLREFFDRPRISGDTINFYEYAKKNWTFHAKGIWIEKSQPRNSVATIIGYRSTFRDLEAQVLLVTKNENLMRKILEEKQNLMENCHPIDLSTFLRKDHFVPGWIKYFSRFFRNFF